METSGEANIPAIIRGLIAIAWYGVQTYLASQALIIIFLKFWPGTAALNDPALNFLGLPPLGYICYAILWVAQAAVFWNGMEAIRKFIDFAGPAVYVVMIILCVYLVSRAGIGNISLNLLRAEPELRRLHPGDDLRHRAGGVLLRRPDAQLR